MAPYKCRTCGTADPDLYVICNHPACPDGRDQGIRPYQMAHNQQPLSGHARPNGPWTLILVAVFTALFMTAALWLAGMVRPANAMDHGFDPNSPTTKWFESLLRPDYPDSSCCGKADGYPVDRYWKNPDGTWTAVIADGSAEKWPDGQYRQYIATGTEVIVPADKVNDMTDDLDNPTNRSWIFMRVNAAEAGNVYCFVRHPQGN